MNFLSPFSANNRNNRTPTNNNSTTTNNNNIATNITATNNNNNKKSPSPKPGTPSQAGGSNLTELKPVPPTLTQPYHTPLPSFTGQFTSKHVFTFCLDKINS